MDTMKKIGSLLLAFSLMATPAMINAEDVENNMDKDLINEEAQELEIADYLTYEGHIIDVNNKDGNMSIWVEKNDNPEESIIFHLDEGVLLLSDKTLEKVEIDYLKDDMKVLVYYKSNTPMMLSMPAQARPDGIVIKENEDLNFIKISKFNDELTSVDNDLKLNIQDDTIMVNGKGEKLEKEDLQDENLLVFYGNTTRSIPAQTSPNKVILLDGIKADIDVDLKGEVTIFHKILVNKWLYIEGEESLNIELENKIYKDEDGVLMVPLREIGEALAYKVSWDGQRWAAQLTKDAQWTEVIIGEDNYNFAKMIVKLGTAPVLKNSTTYVPMNFIEEILQMNLNIQEGMLRITE